MLIKILSTVGKLNNHIVSSRCIFSDVLIFQILYPMQNKAQQGAACTNIRDKPFFASPSSFDREILRISERDKLHIQSLQNASAGACARSMLHRSERDWTTRSERAPTVPLLAAPLGRKSYE